MVATFQNDSHGRELRSCEVGEIRISEVAVPPALRLARHRHATGQVVFVLEGSYRERWRERSVRLGPGAILYRPPGVGHTNAFGRDEALALVVAYRAERLRRLGSSPARPLALSPVLADLRAQLAAEWAREDPASRTALEGIALLLLARVGRATPGELHPPWLRAALAFVERRFHEGIGLADVADEVEMHRATVAAGFRRHLGRSVGEVLRGVRLGHALAEIRATRHPLAEVAAACGYFDQSHMSRQVKQATGATPGELRRRG